MTVRLLFGEEIRSHVLKILSGECVFIRRPLYPKLYILSPWISDVTIDFSENYVSDELLKLKEKQKLDSFLFSDYNIKCINLPYALLLFKLHSSCEYYQNVPEINIVTLPPSEDNYSPGYLPIVKTLLEFLDEIGCNVFTNSRLHSKLLLANDLALLGSFNLSSSALLYNREEIGISINDLDNLESLEAYCLKVIGESERYGYTSLLHYGKRREKSDIELDWHLTELLAEAMEQPPSLEKKTRIKELLDQSNVLHEKSVYSPSNGITRGWLLDFLIERVYGFGYGEFLNITGGYDKFIKSYAYDLNLFYLMSLRRLIASAKGKNLVVDQFKLGDNESTDSIIESFNGRFARKAIPNVKLRLKSLTQH